MHACPVLCCAVRQCIIWRLPSDNNLHEKGHCTEELQGSLYGGIC